MIFEPSMIRPFASLILITALLAPTPFAGAAPVEMKADTTAEAPEALPKDAVVTGLTLQPATIVLDGTYDAVQLLLSAQLANGEKVDVTRLAQYKLKSAIASLSATGHMQPVKNGRTKVDITFAGQRLSVPVEIRNVIANQKVDFIRDVNPVLTKLGCNQGTCHGSKEGKFGFKLSLRGYDPLFDVRALVDDLAGRRVNLASPDDSLMLLKATAGVPHEGGQRTKVGDKYYNILRAWIADGAALNIETPRVTGIEIVPKDPVVQQIGSRQQVRIIASYANGTKRDVTAESFVDSGNTDVAVAADGGLVKTLRRGEAPILARFEGAYAATTVTVMGDRSGFAWQEPPTFNKIDEFVAAKWKRMKILPSDLCSDSEFIRRVYLDLTGLPPSPEQLLAFTADKRETQVKRNAIIDSLIGSPEFVDHLTSKWGDLLQVNRKFLGEEGAKLFREWIHSEVAANTPYDQFVRKILTAVGSNKENPAAAYFKVLRTPDETMENTTHLFLATRFNCNKCHDHPFERWTQNQYYEMAAFFAQVDLKRDPASGDKNIGGTAVEGAKPLFEIAYDKTEGEEMHLRTGKIAPPDFPYQAAFNKSDKTTRREKLASWMTSPDNRYFAMSYANRIWGYLTGVGVIEPLDDIRAGNPATNPELLEYLTREFVQGGFDVRKLMRQICQSRTYQLSIATHKWNEDDKINYSHATARRLPAEVLFDSVQRVTGSTPSFPGVAAGTRASQLTDSSIDVPSGLLANLGRPPRESSCECERSNDIRLGSVMSLLSGPAVSQAINNPQNEIARLSSTIADDRQLVDALFLRILNRHASDKEVQTTLAAWKEMDQENTTLSASLAEAEKKWAPIEAQKQKERAEAVAKAEAAVKARETEIAPKLAEDEKKRLEKIAAAEKAAAAADANLSASAVEWEKALATNRLVTGWTLLQPKDLKATAENKLVKLDDGSILSSGPQKASDFTITTETSVTNITGVLLEMLPDNSLPNFGPGRANDGNFVLSEIKLDWMTKGDKKALPAAFKDAAADFSQANFEVKDAIDSKVEGNRNGWAISGKPFGEPRYARFSLAKPIGNAAGATLTINMQHRFQTMYMSGRFRLWITTSDKPLELGLPQQVIAALKAPADQRTDEQKSAIYAHLRSSDLPYIKKHQAIVIAKKPLPADAPLVELRTALAKASEPVVIDPKLVQLRQDAEMSKKQLTAKRLTGAQDLAWALINNPSFLFNR